MNIDHAKWLAAYSQVFGVLDGSKRDGIETLLSAIGADPAIVDLRWAAYVVATIKHECADRWQPLEEFGKGAGKPYGQPVTVVGSDGQPYTNTYYGRGYVQITWEENYARLSKVLGMNDDLVLHPERALEPAVAYRIASEGMRGGLFTGKKLSDYIHDQSCDYTNARRIINGLDQAARITAYSDALEAIFKESVQQGMAHGIGEISR